MINGKTLIELGFKPGKWFGEAIRIANEQNLSGKSLHSFLEARQPTFIEPLEQPVAYHKNIAPMSAMEFENTKKVFETMDVVMQTPTVVAGAVMPDACPTGTIGQIPVGGVVVAKNAIHPGWHSADICCSVMATHFGYINPAIVMNVAAVTTHFGPGGREEFSELPEGLLNRIKANRFLNDERSIELAHSHLGTQGDGNHFLYVGTTPRFGGVMLVTHHGSRGFGAALYKKGMVVAERHRRELSPKTNAKNAWIPFDTQDGRDYWEALQIVRDWTKLNHSTIHNAIYGKIRSGSPPGVSFWNEHNFVFKDGDLFYHAKGATPLDDKFVPDSSHGLRLIPLNMAQPILVVRGDTTETNLGFAPHGAGRNVSRSEHKRGLADKTDSEIFAEETAGLDVRFFSKNIDISELPSAYKDADNVQQQMEQFGLGTVVNRIMPYGSIMAGNFKNHWETD